MQAWEHQGCAGTDGRRRDNQLGDGTRNIAADPPGECQADDQSGQGGDDQPEQGLVQSRRHFIQWYTDDDSPFCCLRSAVSGKYGLVIQCLAFESVFVDIVQMLK